MDNGQRLGYLHHEGSLPQPTKTLPVNLSRAQLHDVDAGGMVQASAQLQDIEGGGDRRQDGAKTGSWVSPGQGYGRGLAGGVAEVRPRGDRNIARTETGALNRLRTRRIFSGRRGFTPETARNGPGAAPGRGRPGEPRCRGNLVTTWRTPPRRRRQLHQVDAVATSSRAWPKGKDAHRAGIPRDLVRTTRTWGLGRPTSEMQA